MCVSFVSAFVFFVFILHSHTNQQKKKEEARRDKKGVGVEEKITMLAFACNSYYDMLPLQFEEDAPGPERDPMKSPNQLLEVGTVVARIGPLYMPDLVKSVVGMLHFGIITKEVLPPLHASQYKQSEELTHLYFEDKRWLRTFYLKRQYFDRFRIQHYVKHGSAQVKETTLGVFLFGDDAWLSGSWYKRKFPKCWKINVPQQNVEQLQRKNAQIEGDIGGTQIQFVYAELRKLHCGHRFRSQQWRGHHLHPSHLCFCTFGHLDHLECGHHHLIFAKKEESQVGEKEDSVPILESFECHSYGLNRKTNRRDPWFESLEMVLL